MPDIEAAGRAQRHQRDGGGVAFVHPEPDAAFFCALRFLVAVSSDLNGCTCVLKEVLSKFSRRSLYSRPQIRSLAFIAALHCICAARPKTVIGGGAACRN